MTDEYAGFVCVCVCLMGEGGLMLISGSILIPCLVHRVNAGNSIPHTHTAFPSPCERNSLAHIFNKHHLTARINNRAGVMVGSVNPNALVTSSSTLHQLSSSMSSLCFTCPLAARSSLQMAFHFLVPSLLCWDPLRLADAPAPPLSEPWLTGAFPKQRPRRRRHSVVEWQPPRCRAPRWWFWTWHH